MLFKIHSYKPIEKYEEKNDMGSLYYNFYFGFRQEISYSVVFTAHNTGADICLGIGTCSY